MKNSKGRTPNYINANFKPNLNGSIVTTSSIAQAKKVVQSNKIKKNFGKRRFLARQLFKKLNEPEMARYTSLLKKGYREIS